MNVRKVVNVPRGIAYPAMSPRLHFRFSRDHVLHMVLLVHRAHLGIRRASLVSSSACRKASITSMLNTKMGIE